jgi:hypothetical protein
LLRDGRWRRFADAAAVVVGGGGEDVGERIERLVQQRVFTSGGRWRWRGSCKARDPGQEQRHGDRRDNMLVVCATTHDSLLSRNRAQPYKGNDTHAYDDDASFQSTHAYAT